MDAAAREKLLRAGRAAALARDHGATLVVEGARVIDVAEAVEAVIRREGARPAFPCCVSLNEEAAHYSPAVADATTLALGDVVKLDCGAHVDGFIADTAITIEVGSRDEDALIDAARAGLDAALSRVAAGVAVRDVGRATESAVRARGFRPIDNLSGHSMEPYHLHAGLTVPSVAAGVFGRFAEDMVVAIEPFVTRGRGRIRSGRPGHIWHFRALKRMGDALADRVIEHVADHHGALPFSERWIAAALGEEGVSDAMRRLERAGALYQYPVLVEVSRGQVAQFEHTVIVSREGCEATTSLD